MNLRKSFRNRLLLPFYVVATMFTSTAHARADVVVVVSSTSPITHISSEQISNIFLGKISIFPNGVRAIPVDQTEGSEIREEFYSRVINKTSAQLNAYWAKAIFSGDSFPPMLLHNNIAVRKSIANDPNIIGYMDRSAVDSSVRVIFEP